MTRTSSNPSPRPDDIEDEEFVTETRRDVSGEKLKRLALDLVGRWYWIALGLVIGFLSASYYLSKAPKQYRATSTLLIKHQIGSVMGRDQVDEIDFRSQEGMNTIAERIRRMDLIERVAARQDVRELAGLVPPPVNWRPDWVNARMAEPEPETTAPVDPPAPPYLAGMIASWLDVSIRRGTRLVDISITHRVPEVSKALADAVALEYLTEVTSARTEGRSNSIELLQKESENARENLQTARGAMATYTRALEMHQRLDAKEGENQSLERRYLPKHPRMAAAVAELKQIQDQFLKEFDVARLAASDKAYWEAAGRVLPDKEAEPELYLRVARQQLMERTGVLESEIQSSTAVFNSMLTRIEEASVNQEAEESSADINNLARVPGYPSAPVASKTKTTGSAAGFGVGLAIALLLVRMDNKYHTVAQISGETGINVLAAVAEINPRHLAAAERTYLKDFPDQPPHPSAEWDEMVVFRPGTSSTSYAEMYRVLRASISLLGDETRRKVTLFTSALPGEGKTSTSVNFALAAAGQGRKTLLIDLDLRKPSVHRAFNMPREQERGGITECLANQAAYQDVIIRETGQECLHLILSGKRAPNPGELLDIERLKAILQRACRDYDVIVLDTAPLLAVSDTRIIGPLAHNICLVARADYVPKGAVRRALETLDEDGTPLSGIIFNSFKQSRRLIGENYSYGYYKTSRYGNAARYGYGSYNSYGSYGEEDESKKPRKNRRRVKAKAKA
jgi:polysaccharide biosynthesis transport protein